MLSIHENAGSSPLARGLLYDGLKWIVQIRIIPARAGFTSSDKKPSLRARDHPRSRGVYGLTGDDDQALAGSSPLARGLHAIDE